MTPKRDYMTAFDIFVKAFLNEQLPLDNFMGKNIGFPRGGFAV